MRRLWLSVALLLVVFVLTLLNSLYLKQFSMELTETLSQAEAEAERGNWERAEALTQEALDCWQEKNMYLYTMLRHSDTDSVYTGFREVEEFIHCQESGEYSAANARLLAQIELLYEMEQFTLKNIL